MPATLRVSIVVVVMWCVNDPSGVIAQGTSSFDQLVQSYDALVTAKSPEVERVDLVANWVQANDWRSLALANQAWLHAKLLAVDQVNPSSFAVRFTGFITAPANGVYTFVQHQLPSAYGGTLKLVVDGKVILDTTSVPRRLGWGPELAPPAVGAYRSQAVELVAGRAMPIEVDFVYQDEFPRIEDRSAQWRFPLALLLWESGGGTARIVPREALTPPGDFANSGNHGLRADYFKDAKLSTPAGSFLEPGVELMWNQRAVLPRHKSLQELILSELRSRITSPTAIPVDEAAIFVRQCIGQVLPGLCAEDRDLAMRNLSVQVPLVQQIEPATFASWMPQVAMLPSLVHVDVLTAWSNYYVVPPPRIAPHIGYGPGSYAAANYGSYRLAGLWFVGPGWPAAEVLIDKHLQRSDGSCNLLIDYIVSFGARYERVRAPIFKVLEAHVTDNSLSADARVTWLMAKGYARELFIGGLPKPDLAIASLEEAQLIAESAEVKFRLFEEIVPRLAAIGQTTKALEMVNAYGQSSKDAAQQEVIGRLRTEVTALADYYRSEQLHAEERQANTSRAIRIKELRYRLDSASKNGDTELVNHYRQALLSAGIAVEELPK